MSIPMRPHVNHLNNIVMAYLRQLVEVFTLQRVDFLQGLRETIFITRGFT